MYPLGGMSQEQGSPFPFGGENVLYLFMSTIFLFIIPPPPIQLKI